MPQIMRRHAVQGRGCGTATAQQQGTVPKAQKHPVEFPSKKDHPAFVVSFYCFLTCFRFVRFTVWRGWIRACVNLLWFFFIFILGGATSCVKIF